MFSKATSANPWPTYSPDHYTVVLNNKDSGELYIANSSDQILAKAGIQSSSCEGLQNLLKVTNHNVDFLNGVTNQFQVFQICGGDLFPCSDAGKFQDLGKEKPVLYLQLPLNLGSGPAQEYYSSPEKAITRLALHEPFHINQFLKWKNVFNQPDRDSLIECAKNLSWKASLLAEIKFWKSTPIGKLSLPAVQKILQRRKLNADPELQKCWQTWEFFERLEGTAFFVEQAARIRSGIDSEKQIETENRIMLSQVDLLITGAPGAEPFYATGGMICHLLSQSQPSLDWQHRIEMGASPADVIRSP